MESGILNMRNIKGRVYKRTDENAMLPFLFMDSSRRGCSYRPRSFLGDKMIMDIYTQHENHKILMKGNEITESVESMYDFFDGTIKYIHKLECVRKKIKLQYIDTDAQNYFPWEEPNVYINVHAISSISCEVLPMLDKTNAEINVNLTRSITDMKISFFINSFDDGKVISQKLAKHVFLEKN
jgi:hypothetical protein